VNKKRTSSRFSLFVSAGVGAAIGAVIGIIAYTQDWLG